jgi:ferredoxin
MSLNHPIASTAARRKVGQPAADLVADFDVLVTRALAEGFHVAGLPLARALIDKPVVAKLKKLLFNAAALDSLRGRARRIEFLAEGPLPPEFLLEPLAKSEAIYSQIIDYSLCKGCRLCIQVCPKHVYKDDGFGKPDRARRDEECTGNAQCGQCVYVCPERAITTVISSPMHESTLFVLLPNPFAAAQAKEGVAADFALANPLDVDEPLSIDPAYDAKDLPAAHRVLEGAGFFPVLEIGGYDRHLVDGAEPETLLELWAKENGRGPAWVLGAVHAIYASLPGLSGLKQGKYRFDGLIHRVIDEILYAAIDTASDGGRALLESLLAESRIVEGALGARRRPIGGLLPPGTSVAWKTPYGNQVPVYSQIEKCLGPECGLCVSHCPEGNGGETSAIRFVPLVPLGVIPAMVRGLQPRLLRLDGSHASIGEAEDLLGKKAFAFEVDTEYCKSCGICIACCPHDVIEPAPRKFDMGGQA